MDSIHKEQTIQIFEKEYPELSIEFKNIQNEMRLKAKLTPNQA